MKRSDVHPEILKENDALLSGKVGFFERLIVPSKAIEQVLPEGVAAESILAEKSNRYRIAKVGQADQVNGNRRIYPRKEWAAVIDRAEAFQIPQGKLGGSVDHLGFLEGGNLKNAAILWKTLEIDASGEVLGEFEIVDTRVGKDLKAWIEAGGAVGFSTYGYASAHEPSDEERTQYGLGEDDHAVVIDDWELVKIDAVDNPSVRDAFDRTKRDNKAGAAGEHVQENRSGGEEKQMTIEQLKKDHPELFAQVEKLARESAEQLATAESNKAKAAEDKANAVKALVEGLVKDLAEKHGVTLVKDVLPEDAQKQVEKLQADHKAALEKLTAEKDAEIKGLTEKLAAQKVELDKVAAEKQTASDEAAKLTAEKAENDRVAAVKAKAAELLKGNRFAPVIAKHVESLSADKAFTAEKVADAVKAKTEEYEAVAGAASESPDVFDITGETRVESGSNDDASGALPIVSELAESMGG
jgi:hypothetical protein